jgi:signal transduction histidine kinase
VKSLYVRIWLTVLAALALFALASGWLMQRHMAAERERLESQTQSRAEAWADLLQRSLPPADAPAQEQAMALQEWSTRLRLPLALDDAGGQRIAASESFQRREDDAGPGPPLRRLAVSVPLADGRSLWIARPNLRRRPGPGEASGMPMRPMPPGPYSAWPMLPGLPDGAGLLLLVGLLFLAVGAGAYPVVRRLTRRLELLKHGVETFGAGALDHRVAVEGRDEVAAVARSFNEAAGRIETLLRSNQSLLANASHELRSPLARLKMAVALLDEAPPAQTQRLRQEIHTNIAELDALVEEVLLSSRLDTVSELQHPERVELLVLAAEEAARVQGSAGGEPLAVMGEERLLRRALRNLLENARRYGRARTDGVGEAADGDVVLDVQGDGQWVELRVCDRGPGVPEAYRERIFEAFFRLPGHAEREGGVGLGLALVRQIAQRHGGTVRCEPRPGGGSCFVLRLPRAV